MKPILALIVIYGSIAASAAAVPSIRFRDVTAASGINVSHIATPENRYIIESMSGGAAVFDCNGDGYLDVATVNGSSVERFKAGGDPFITLYRQIDGATSTTPRFENITESAGLKRKGWGMAVTAIDFDNDGILDLFVTGYGGNAMYHGTGQCKFEDVTDHSVLRGQGFMTGAAWADYDRDGDLDLFVAGYVVIDLDKLPVFGSSVTCSFNGIRVQCGPRGLPGERDYFYRNRGDGTFEEVGQKVGVSDDKKYFGLGAIWGDYDNDGWPDLYVANDENPNFLYHNNRDGTLTDVGFASGTAYSGDGAEQGSMGVAWGDLDLDGRLDLFTTNFQNEHNTLYRDLGPRGFLDISMESKIGAPSIPFVGWGTGFVDFDNDGWLDILVANGHVYPQIEFAKSKTQMGYGQDFLLHRNLGNSTFEDVTDASGLRDLPLRSRRGAAFGDLNNDGLVDVIVTNVGEVPTVLLNTTENTNHRVTLKLIQTNGNRDAIGARATLRTNKRSMMSEVTAGDSYLSQSDLRLHFGLGSGETIESVELRWSGGEIEKVNGVMPDKIVTITQNKGVTGLQRFRTR